MKSMQNTPELTPQNSPALAAIEADPTSDFSQTAMLLISITDYFDHLEDYRLQDHNDPKIISESFDQVIDALRDAIKTDAPFLLVANDDDLTLQVILNNEITAYCEGITAQDLINDPNEYDVICLGNKWNNSICILHLG